jgi:hypothetical protein
MPNAYARRVLRSLAPLALAAAWLAPTAARAQFDAGTTTTTANFDATDFFIGVQAQPNINLSDYQVARFFNKANCDCNVPIYIYVTLVDSGFQKRTSVLAGLTASSSIEFWLGQQCDQTNVRQATCQLLKQEPLIQFLMLGHDTITTDAQTMSAFVAPGTAAAGTFAPNTTCTSPIQNTYPQTIWALVSPTGQSGIYTPNVQRNVTIDMTPPPEPPGVTVVGGNQGLTVSWTKLDTALYTDLLGYQILCNRAGALQVFDTGTFTPGFLTCPATIGPNGVDSLDPAFICSPLLTTTASSYRVQILQNQITYGVTVVAVDNSGNASVPDVFYGTPIKTKSFYDAYRDGNTGSSQDLPGGATGGFCALGPGAARTRLAPLGAAGGLAVGLLLARRRRRR